MNTAHTLKFEGQTTGEEIANSITHGIGALLSIAATALLATFAGMEGNAPKIVGVSIFGFTMIVLYTVSCLYHAWRTPGTKHLLHVMDHSAIFALIAGTYTPITLAALKGGWGWSLFGVVWGLAVIGITATLLAFERARYFNVVLYILMGWLIVITGPRMFRALSPMALMWLLTGGAAYTVGVVFYKMKRMPYHHMVWHLFVLGGSVCHFFMMMAI